ncbi:MAG: amidohydrolase family protein [Planctomycetota bacterium]|nr:amidohydrolase family protein [Planctomycetota bacterium]MDA1214856.1 amidohydrolase family protein [Planctomycetota bacterium]
MSRFNAVTRRNFLKTSAAVVGAASLVERSYPAAADDELLIIDCHAHIYGEDETKYPTIDKPYRPPAGKGTLAHLKREMQANGVRYVTAIQTSTFYRFDNRYTADTSRDNREFMAGVVTLDPDNEQSPELLKIYVRDFNVRGMRSIPAKSGKLDDPGVERLWSVAEELGIVINVLTNRDHRGEIESLAGRHADLRIVIDHCLNIATGPDRDKIVTDVVALSALPNAHVKLTFIPTGSAEEYPCRDLHEACLRVIDAFTPQRCVWGSDFPCELWCPKVSYAQHLKIFTHELGLDTQQKKAILGETARRLWFANE